MRATSGPLYQVPTNSCICFSGSGQIRTFLNSLSEIFHCPVGIFQPTRPSLRTISASDVEHGESIIRVQYSTWYRITVVGILQIIRKYTYVCVYEYKRTKSDYSVVRACLSVIASKSFSSLRFLSMEIHCSNDITGTVHQLLFASQFRHPVGVPVSRF